jgi:hypothetical protein
MPSLSPKSFRRAAVWLPALSLLLAPLASQAKEREMTEQFSEERESQRDIQTDPSIGGRAGIIEEFNFGPTGMDVVKQQELRKEGATQQLSGRVVDMKGQTLYVARDGVVVPLDTRELRITKQPKKGQLIIASYTVQDTHNVALSLAGEVASSRAE